MILRKSIFIFILFYREIGFAANAAHGEIPWSTIQAQAFNLTLFLILTVYFLRKPISEYMMSYRNSFLDESMKAQKVIENAEKQKKIVDDQLVKLETTYSNRIETSKKEAQIMRDNMIGEAETRSEKMIVDSNENAVLLFKSAEQTIKRQVLHNAITTSKVELVKKMGANESDRIQDEFLQELTTGLL